MVKSLVKHIPMRSPEALYHLHHISTLQVNSHSHKTVGTSFRPQTKKTEKIIRGMADL